MAFIRVGFFEDFKGADTLLVDVDHEGLNALIAWLQTVTSSGRKTAINHCPGAVVQSGLHVDLSRVPNDTETATSIGRRATYARGSEARSVARKPVEVPMSKIA